MKKVLLMVLVALISVCSVFAIESSRNVNARIVGEYGQYGVSFDVSRFELGGEVWTKASPVMVVSKVWNDPDFAKEGVTAKSGYVFGAFNLTNNAKADFSLGAGVEISTDYAVYGQCELALHLSKNHAITARVLVPVYPMFEDVNDIVAVSSLGYCFSF